MGSYQSVPIPLRIAVIDSGVHALHPHVNGVAGGVWVTDDSCIEGEYTDRLGHGTAVTAVIREKAPEAEVHAVKIFHTELAASIETLIRGIDWSVRNGVDLINLSLGVANPAHEPLLRAAIERVRTSGIQLVAAYEDDGVRWLPGSLPGVIPVAVDWDCPRDEYRTGLLEDGRTLYRGSGFPRPIPGVPPERNLKGISFAVANVTGLLAAAMIRDRDPKSR